MPRNFRTKRPDPLATLPLVGPGFSGLNTELNNAAGFIDADWAAVLSNAVFDDLGRITSRKGYVDQTTTPITGTPDVWSLHEYVRDDETVSLIAVTSAFTIWESTDNGATWTNISGDFTTNGLATTRVQFANFEDDLYAVASGFRVYRYNTALGSFSEIATSPITNGTLIATFGRLWAGGDATSTISYSGLLAGTDWTSAASGTIDASNAWTNGNDSVQAIAAFGATLVVFGKRHVLLYVDGAGSELGVDPDNLYVVDTIEGTGCENRDSIVNIGEGDLWFLGPNGIQSLARVIQDKVNPLVDISKNVRSLVSANIQQHVGSAGNVQAIYSAQERFCLFLFPEAQQVLGFDTRFPLDDGTWRAYTWDSVPYFSLVERRNGDIGFGLTAGNYALYTGYRDDGTVFDLSYASPWLNWGQEGHSHVKIVKSAYMFVYGRETLSGTFRWSYDFRPLERSQTWTSDYVASGAEWGSGEWGSGEFGDGLRMRKVHIALSHQGQFFKAFTTIQSTDVDDKVAIQEIGIRAKLGRRT